MKVRDVTSGEIFKVVKIDYLLNYPNDKTEYTLEDGRTFTNGELWVQFTQVPEMNFGMGIEQ